MATYFEQSLQKLKEFEASIPWMYLDTVGKVTVGVGLMLPDEAAAERLPFVVGGRGATSREIDGEFARVSAMAAGRAAQFYQQEGGLSLADEEIGRLLNVVLTGFEDQVRAGLVGYDALPDAAKMALLDMAYNLGPAKLLGTYPSMLRAIRAGDWATAAAQSLRHGPGATRNEWTRQMFLSCVPQADGVLKKVGFGVLGITASMVSKLRK